METVWIIVQILIGYNLVLPLVFHWLSRYQTEDFFKLTDEEFDYGIIVTAYQETSLLPEVINSLLALNYSRYLIYLVADDCDTSTLTFDSERVVVLRPENVLANNVKSHFYAINHFKRNHDIVTIIDSDNLVHEEYLNELNVFFNKGFKAVQGYRKPKPLSTDLAQLDAIRDIYYHYYDGELLFKLGSSATLAGSGMAFKTNLYLTSFRNLEVSGAGFDKVLQAQIVRKNKRIAFAPHAIVYDEKTKFSNQLVKQRARWINTWFKYASLGFGLIRIGFRNKWVNPLVFGITLLRPPLFIFIALSLLCLVINIWTSLPGTILWVLAFSIFIYSFFLPLKGHKNKNEIYRALWSAPRFIALQFMALFYAKGANRRSVATRHQIE